MAKWFRRIHLWLSVPFGVVITLVCFSGAMLVYEQEITQSLRPRLYYVEQVGPAPLPLDSLMARVQATLPDTVQATDITVQSDPRRTWQVSLSAPRRASVYVDPYTGQVTGRNERLPFFDTMFHLHRWLLGPSQSASGGLSAGKLLVGISTLVLVIVLLTGILMWLTNRHKPLRKSLTISVTKGWHRFWHDLHVAGGIYATLFLLAIALTGLTWSFGWYRTGFYALFGVEQQAGSGHSGHGGHGSHGPRASAHGGTRGDNRAAQYRGQKHQTDSLQGQAPREALAAAPAGAEGGQDRHGGHGARSRRASAHEGAPAEGQTALHPRRTRHQADSLSGRPSRDTLAVVPAEAEDRHGTHGRHGSHGTHGHWASAHEGAHDDSRAALHQRRMRHQTDSLQGQPPRDTLAAVAAEAEGGSERHEGHGVRSRRAAAHDGAHSDNRTAALHSGRVRQQADSLQGQPPRDTLAAVAAEAGFSPCLHWQKVFEQLAQAHAGYRQITLSDGTAGVVPEGRRSLRAADTYDFDPLTGRITDQHPYAESDKGTRVRSAVYMVHTGSWLGGLTRLVNFLASLLGATLPLTGYYLWIRRLLKRRKRRR